MRAYLLYKGRCQPSHDATPRRQQCRQLKAGCLTAVCTAGQSQADPPSGGRCVDCVLVLEQRSADDIYIELPGRAKVIVFVSSCGKYRDVHGRAPFSIVFFGFFFLIRLGIVAVREVLAAIELTARLRSKLRYTKHKRTVAQWADLLGFFLFLF